jgi:hypothetical protein
MFCCDGGVLSWESLHYIVSVGSLKDKIW